MPKNRTFVGGPLDGQQSTGRSIYRSTSDEAVGTEKGDRLFVGSQFKRSTPAMYEKLRYLYVARGDRYELAFDVKRQLIAESCRRHGLPPMEEGDHLRVTLHDGREIAGTVEDIMGPRVWVRPTPTSAEIKIEWSDVIASVVVPLYAGALV